MKTKIFCMMVLCTGLLVGCDKEPIIPEEPVKPPVEQPEEPGKPEEPEKPEEPGNVPSTDGIIKINVGDLNMVVGSKDWKSIVYGNGKYVAVGYGGYITTSTDGVNWDIPVNVGSKDWESIVYGNGKYVVTGGYGNTISSIDGTNWTIPIRIGISPDNFPNIIYNNGKFVAVGSANGGISTTSVDGVNWTEIKRKLSNGILNCITYGNGQFVSIDNYGNVICSTNGEDWSAQVNALDRSKIHIQGIAYGNGKFVAVGIGSQGASVSISEDGINWNTPTVITNKTTSWQNITFYKGKFITVGDMGCIATSVDGINWAVIQVKDEDGSIIYKNLYGVCAIP